MIKRDDLNIATLASNNACFDLQFRKDTRRERTGSPTYYHWKAQFVITTKKDNVKALQKARSAVGCGRVWMSNGQARFSVQKIDEIKNVVIPFFIKNKLAENKRKNFELWQKAVEIIFRNKGKSFSAWKKNDMFFLLQIQQAALKYKNNPRQAKWLGMARNFAKTS